MKNMEVLARFVTYIRYGTNTKLKFSGTKEGGLKQVLATMILELFSIVHLNQLELGPVAHE
jgi:hypothetical protein